MIIVINNKEMMKELKTVLDLP